MAGKCTNVLLALFLSLLFALSPQKLTHAEQVTFKGPPIEPSAFKKKKAKAQGIELKAAPGREITGYLFKPAGAGKSSTAVILSSIHGINKSHLAWAELLKAQGLASLVVDGKTTNPEEVLHFLGTQDFVDQHKLLLMGFSVGGRKALKALQKQDQGMFRAGIIFYANCDPSKKMTAPALVLLGGKDAFVSVEKCRELAADENLSLVVYEEATHFFDDPAYRRNKSVTEKPPLFDNNHYDPEAHVDALARVRGFLERQF